MNDKVNETVMDEVEEQEQISLEDETEFDPYALYQEEEGRIIVPLKYPVKVKARQYEEMRIRPPYGADLRIAGNAKNDTDNGMILLERCGEGWTKEAVNKMRATDIAKCSEVLNFLAQE